VPNPWKILVTGGAGFIGSHVVDRYVESGHEVFVLDSLVTGRRDNLNPAARFVKRDLRDAGLDEFLAREQFDVVNHHAAQVDVRQSMADPVYDAQVNIVGGLNLVAAAAAAGVRRFVYVSTGGAVYGEPEYLPVDEAHPIVPICPYGVSKYTVELYLEAFRASAGLDYVVLRYPNVYGPRQNPDGEAGVVAIFAAKMLRGEPCTINGDGSQERDFVAAADCVAANMLVSDPDRALPHRVYNLASGEATSVNTLFATLAQITGYTRPALHGPPKAGETYKIYLDSSRARTELGWSPQVTLAEGLRATVSSIQ
jgi:UDP-glucose 4-epimerase